MRASLIIGTANRAAQLEAALCAIDHIDLSKVNEIIVVDNASTDDTREVILNHEKVNPKIKYLYEGKRGLSRAKNAGIAHSDTTSDVIIFTDDDCYPGHDFVNHTLTEFEQNNIVYLGGRVLLYDEKDARTSIQECEDEFFIEPDTVVKPGLIHGANFSFRRRILVDVGGFDIRFGPGSILKSAEDVELLMRLSQAGYMGKYSPKPFVYHNHGRRKSEMSTTGKKYDIGRGAYLAKFMLRSFPDVIRQWLTNIYCINTPQRTLHELEGFLLFYLATIRFLPQSLRMRY